MQLRHLLHRHFPDLDPARLPGGFDRVGDIAVVSLTPELAAQERAIGALILAAHPQLRVVARRAGDHEGAFRTRPLAVIAGEERLTTVHRENGVSLHQDLGRVYFSVRMAHERARIAALVRPEERVAVLCSGAGPFPLIIARHSRPQLVVGIELNPAAHRLALTSLRANRRLGAVRFVQGDAAEAVAQFPGLFDRVLVVLPRTGETLLPAALDALRPGGTLHFYAMRRRDEADAAPAAVERACALRGRRPGPVTTVVCGHCGPGEHRVCLDCPVDTTT